MEKWRKWDGWLSHIDGLVRDGVSGVSLISEVGVPPQQTRLALRFHVRMREHLPVSRRYAFTKAHDLSLIAAIVAVSQDRYRRGGLWPYVNEALVEQGHKHGLDPATQAEFREIFIDGLRELRLPTVGDGYELVDTAAMHAGIPTYCLSDWFTLTQRASRHVGPDGDDMTLWANSNADRPAMSGMAQPIKRMLASGPEFAADLFERAAELLDHLSPNYEQAELGVLGAAPIEQLRDSGHPAVVEAARIGLEPRWVIKAAQYLYGDDRRPAQTQIARRSKPARPTLRLDLDEGELILTLPAIPDAQEPVHWEVVTGHRRRTITAELDTSGDTVSSSEVSVAVSQPIRVLTVATAGADMDLPLWADGAPAVFFTMSGAHRPVTASVVQTGSYWVLLPADARMTSNGANIEIARDDCPVGWGGWELVHVELSPGQQVTISRPEGSFNLRVQGGLAPELLLPPPVPGTRSLGLPVMGQRPRVRIPVSGVWRISVTRRGETDPLWTQGVTEPGEYELLRGLFGQAGAFEVTVRGPLGHGMKESFALVDGLTVNCHPAHRRLDQRGQLEHARANAAAGTGIRLDPGTWQLAADAGGQLVKVKDSEGRGFSFTHRPSATMVGTFDEYGVLRWRTRPARVDSATLDSSPELIVRMPGQGPPELVATSGAQLVQRVTGRRQLGGWRYRLGELSGAFQQRGPLRLCLDDGQPVAFVAPIPSYRGVALTEDGQRLALLEWSGDSAEMAVWVWLANAAWRPPVRLDLQDDGTAVLPQSHQLAGPLLAHVRAVDPWLDQDEPRLPTPVTRVTAEGEPELSPVEQAIVAAATGTSREPLNAACAATLVDIWLSGPEAVRLGAFWEDRLRQSSAGIGPELAAEMAARDLDRYETASVLVRSGAAMAPADMSLTDAACLWSRAPWLAGAVACAAISWADRPDADLDGEAAETMRRAAHREFGSSLLTILDTGTDKLQAVGRFDASAGIFESMLDEQVAGLVAELGIVPSALLDEDSRAGRVLALSRLRDTPGVIAIPNIRPKVLEAVAALRYSGHEELADGITALVPHAQQARHHWLPTFARAAATVSRLAARGDDRARQVAALSVDSLARLAQVDPDLVLAELARAEALIAAGDEHATHGAARGSGEEQR